MAAGKAEEREGGKQNSVKETMNRVEGGQQERQKKGKVGSEGG